MIGRLDSSAREESEQEIRCFRAEYMVGELKVASR